MSAHRIQDAVTVESLRKTAAGFPSKPGVYLMRDAEGSIIYVGKAGDLRKRVTSYFTHGKDVKTRILVKNIASLEPITTRNEYEALLLENNLIKKWQPRYNINLKDGKSYPVIRITNEPYPRVFRTRRIIQDGSEYFGPFPDVYKLDTYIHLIEKLFPLRKCRGPLKKREHPCLYYHIHRCSAPCAGKTTPEEYMEKVEAIKKLLSGKTADLVRSLKAKMADAVEELRFEEAAELRDAIAAVETVGSTQEVVDFDPEVRDYVAAAEREELSTFVVFQMRGGKLLGRDLYRTESCADMAESLYQFIVQYYSDRETLPRRLYVPEIVDTELLEQFFVREKDEKVDVVVPKRGRHRSVVRMARENAVEDLTQRLRGRRDQDGMDELQVVLGLDKPPRRIEGFDISQLAGTHPVASMVSFYDGVPDKANYRKFHVKHLDGEIDDFEAMREVLARRYTRIINEDEELPDLILVDGGKGQVSAAKSILDALEISHVPLAGLAKREEEIFLPERSEPYRLPETSAALKVLQRVRDESHRFATSFNTQLRRSDVKLGVLEGIKGIGEKRAARLLQQFGSLDRLAEATPGQVSKAAGISEELATNVVEQVRSRTLRGEA